MQHWKNIPSSFNTQTKYKNQLSVFDLQRGTLCFGEYTQIKIIRQVFDV